MKIEPEKLFNFVSQKFFIVLFFITVIITFFSYGNHFIWEFGPSSIHNWRQADSASLAMYYYHEGMNFFKSGIHNGIDGAIVIEFPIFYYVAAIGYHIFGPHDVILRIVHFVPLLIGILYWGRILVDIYKSTLTAFFVISFALGSPLIAFYGFNFLPNTPALGLILIGIGVYYDFLRFGQLKQFYFAIMAFSIAGLIKPTLLVLFLAWAGAWFTTWLFHRKSWEDSIWFPNAFHTLAGIFLVIIFNLGWIKWGEYFNQTSEVRGYYLREIAAIFDLTIPEIEKAFEKIWERKISQLCTRPIFFAFSIGTLINIVFIKKFPVVLRWTYLFSLIGTVLSFIFFFKQFSVHGYYLIDNIPFFLLSISLFVFLLLSYTQNNKILLICLNLILLAGAANSFGKANDFMRKAYQPNQNDIKRVSPAFQKQYELRAFFKDIGVEYSHEKLAVVLPDYSPNISLYKYDLRGWRIIPNLDLAENLKKIATYDKSHYLIISDKNFLNKESILPYLKKPIGNFENEVFVFKLKD